MKLAIIGCGSIGARHLKNAISLGCDCDIVEPNAERREQIQHTYPVRVFNETGLLGLVKPHDAWMVCAPYDQHLFWVDEAIRRRIPVFCEKPLGSLDQIEDWRRLVKASEGLTTQVGYQLRFNASAQALKKHADQGTQMFSVECDMRSWPGQSYGPFLLEASHEIDLALWMGIGALISARLNDAQAWLAFQRGAIHLDTIAETYRRTWVAHGYGVSFCSPEELGDQMYVDELKHFLECVQSGKQTDVPLSDGLRVLEVCAEIERLAKCPA